MTRTELTQVSARGRLIAQLDQVAAWGTDALDAIEPDKTVMRFYIAYYRGDQWRVAFGRISEDGSAFLTAYEAVATSRFGWPFDVMAFTPPREDTSWLREAGTAIAVSLKQPIFSSGVRRVQLRSRSRRRWH